jgi:putative redox protein
MQVIVESRDGLAQQIEMRNKVIVADEPVLVGGTNLGPTPYELLLGALGSCTAMTIIMYARRNGWPVESVRVELTYERIHARDCEHCEEQDAYLQQFNKVVTVRGPLDEAQRARLEEISRRCPVQRTLLGQIQIDDEVRLGE